jgi:eukaryotic-like serine/threonine-protein kinase
LTTDLRERLQSSLGNSYTLDRELGGGGMSRVFTAKETALGRAVVVKVLPPEMAAGVSTERFRREIAVAARLQHPHIVPLLSAGEMDGVPYFTMPFVEGESLRVRLARRGELPVSESVRILREIASALAYAHEHGVVHRDIKPDNVLFSGDVAMVADFGVAKALSASSNGDHGGVTSLGVALGTPAYMAPEQATADPTTDHRADVYAFGVLAYEMLTGQPPFVGRNPSQLLAAQVTEAPEPIARRRPNLPPALAALVMRCLEKRPADRPQSASEIVHAVDDINTPSGGMVPTSATLRANSGALDVPTPGGATPARRDVRTTTLVIGIAMLVLAVAGVAAWKRSSSGNRATATASDAGKPRIAVLPFENLGDSADAYFADGITDAVRGKLTGLANMEVIARASSVQYRATSKTPAEIARELGVRYLLTGTVRWAKGPGSASSVQVSPELVEVSGDGAAASRWQQPFDAEMANVFRVQGDIAGKVAEAMRVAMGGTDQARLVEVPTRDPAAYDAFLRGEALYWSGAGNPPVLRRSVAEYEQAVRLDTGYAAAWAGLSRARSQLFGSGVPTSELARQARDAADRALRLAPGAAFAHSALALYYSNVERAPARALPEMEKAQAAAPNDPDVLPRLAGVYLSLGRLEDAVRTARAAQQLDPRSLSPVLRLRNAFTYLRRYPEAREAADRAIAIAPTLATIYGRAMVSLAEGDLPDARRVVSEGGKRVGEDELLVLMAVSADLGWALDAAAQQRVLSFGPEHFDDDRATWAFVRAQLHGWRGDSALARAWGDSAAREFAAQLRASPNDAQLHALRGVGGASAGHRSEAVAAGERGAALLPVAQELAIGSYLQHQLVRIHLLLGDRDKALDLLEPLLAQPYNLSPGWLRIDPTFAPLRGNPRFDKVIAASR